MSDPFKLIHQDLLFARLAILLSSESNDYSFRFDGMTWHRGEYTATLRDARTGRTFKATKSDAQEAFSHALNLAINYRVECEVAAGRAA